MSRAITISTWFQQILERDNSHAINSDVAETASSYGIALLRCYVLFADDFASQRVKFHFSGLTDSLGVPAFNLRA